MGKGSYLPIKRFKKQKISKLLFHWDILHGYEHYMQFYRKIESRDARNLFIRIKLN